MMSDRIEALVKPLVDCEPAVLASPWHIFDAILEKDPPITYSESLEAWIVGGRRYVLEVLRDTETWSNISVGSSRKANEHFFKRMRELRADPSMTAIVEEFIRVRRGGEVLVTADPPAHIRQRRALSDVFRPKRIQGMKDEIQEISDSLVRSFRPRGHAEWVSDYAVLMPVTILARNFGVPEEHGLTFKRWSDELGVRLGRINPSLEQIRRLILAEREFRQYFTPLLKERERNPQDDLISDIARAQVDGEPLSNAEKLEACQQFVIAGHETTSSNLANIARRVAANPELRDRLAADRSLVPGFVEEVLRLDPPVLGFFRLAKRDTEIAGTKIAAGEYVWVSYAAGNRDPEGCPMSRNFDMTRNPNQHFSFGYGEHACLGAGLARVQSVIGTNALLDLPNVRLAPDHVDDYSDSYILRGLRAVKIAFDPPA